MCYVFIIKIYVLTRIRTGEGDTGLFSYKNHVTNHYNRWRFLFVPAITIQFKGKADVMWKVGKQYYKGMEPYFDQTQVLLGGSKCI